MSLLVTEGGTAPVRFDLDLVNFDDHAAQVLQLADSHFVGHCFVPPTAACGLLQMLNPAFAFHLAP